MKIARVFWSSSPRNFPVARGDELLKRRDLTQVREPLRNRARDSRALDAVPGLGYWRGGANGVPEELVDTGMQRLVGDLDAQPHPMLGYRLMEPRAGAVSLQVLMSRTTGAPR